MILARMITIKTTPLKSIEKIIDDILTVFHLIEEIPQMSDASFKAYQNICSRIPEQIRSGVLKIAVVGVIKSGKSTFVNSLLGRELVKRGAGVITSIITRIRKGRKNRASLYFKSWDQINSQIQKALMLFPDDGSGKEKTHAFDIRRSNDRKYLEKVYQKLITDFQGKNDHIRPETLLIRQALHGFDACKDLVQADEAVTCFESKEFDLHKTFTSDPDKAFYIKDVCLEVFGNMMDPNIEIADCQGADSTDPSQLFQILTYLESSNLIVYCISSRTGLRQSDISFLKQIKNTGLMDNVLFINNCDLTEHENLDDLIKVETGIRDNLKFLEIQPRLFSFSSLYNHFFKLKTKLSKKDLARLQFWQEEKKMVQYCDAKTDEFNSFFKQAIEKNRYELLISNHLKRLGVILAQLNQRTNIFLELLSADKEKEAVARKTLFDLYQNASRLEAIVDHSIEAAVTGLKQEIASKLKQTFVQDKAAILKNAREHIQNVSFEVENYRSAAKESGFNRILYLMFQDFQRQLDLYVVEEVGPQLKKIASALEEKIDEYFQSLFDSYQIDLLKMDRYSEFTDMSMQRQSRTVHSVDIENIKKILGLQLPGRIFEAKYTPRIRANALTGFGLQTVSQIFSSIFNRKSDVSFSPGLRKAGVQIKKENLKILNNQFEQYYNIVHSNYFLPLIEAATRNFKEKIDEQFSRYHSLNKEMEQLFSLKRSEKKDQHKKVVFIKQQIERLARDLSSCSEITRGAGSTN